jgi:hypothetical protein
VGPAAGGPGRKLGTRVQSFKFAEDSAAVALLEHYDIPSSAGVLSVAKLPSGEPKRLGEKVPNYEWGSDGHFLAFSSRVVKPVPIVSLMLYGEGKEKPVKVGEDVYGYGFGPRNAFLLFRNHCTRETRACDLNLLELSKADAAPRKIFENAFSFRASDDGKKVLVTFSRFSPSGTFDLHSVDVASGQARQLDQEILPPALFATKDGRRAVYINASRARAGVYLVDLVP